jgi:hypothetical protein
MSPARSPCTSPLWTSVHSQYAHRALPSLARGHELVRQGNEHKYVKGISGFYYDEQRRGLKSSHCHPTLMNLQAFSDLGNLDSS